MTVQVINSIISTAVKQEKKAMDEDIKELNNIKTEISQGFFEAGVLFQQITGLELNRESIALSEIGRKICLEGRNNSIKLEMALKKIKNKL